MKLKRPTCSTGHDTGVLQRRPLHTSLALERYHKRAKKAARILKRLARRAG